MLFISCLCTTYMTNLNFLPPAFTGKSIKMQQSLQQDQQKHGGGTHPCQRVLHLWEKLLPQASSFLELIS